MSNVKLAETSVGEKFRSKLDNDLNTPWLDNNKTLQTQVSENKWLRWDGVVGTAHDHMDWMHQQAKSLMSEERKGEFREYGERNMCKYFIHDELTQEGDGYGFFKIEGTLQLEPKDLLACCFDFKEMPEIDATVVMMKVLKTYLGEKKGDPFCAAVYWANAPGFPFYYRDGVDLSGYKKDDDGTVWQLGVSAKGNDFVSIPGGISATDRYWAYKLEPQGNGTTNVTLICQTILNGWIPKFLNNYFVCSVLSDYMVNLENEVKKNKESGAHQKLLEQFELDDL
mmetsp:Transcript_29515/g.43141  ORF Transcript_29515/g.43141 Transcript_29515/m.43141 type:complete len:282 (-) Transcript_29515:452-1297(-)